MFSKSCHDRESEAKDRTHSLVLSSKLSEEVLCLKRFHRPVDSSEHSPKCPCHVSSALSDLHSCCLMPPRQVLTDRDFILPVAWATAQEESGWDKEKAVLRPSVDRFEWVTRSQTIFRDISNLEASKSLVIIWPNSAKNTLGDLSWSSSLDCYWLTEQVAMLNESLYPNW